MSGPHAQCAEQDLKCIHCKYVRQKRKCVNCRKGDYCQNPLGRDQGREREEELGDSQEPQDEDQQDGRQRNT